MASFSFKAAAPVVFVVVTVVAQLQAVAFAAKGLGGVGEQREFDYFILALQWPGTSCRNVGVCCPGNACCRPAASPTQFTIHGLWPEYEGNGWPSCCTDATFNENEIIPLIGDLFKYWPTYRCGLEPTCNNRKGSFWAQEYEKHGTCGSPVIVDQYNYFDTTLNLFLKYNINEALENAGVVASDTIMYPIVDIFGAVRSAVGANPKITCGKEGIVKEIWLCFDKQLKPRDCDPTESCPLLVSLPKLPKPEAGMVKGAIPWMADSEAII